MATSKLYQIIPNAICFSCDVCCRFLEADSSLAPIFTEAEKQQTISQGAAPSLFQPQADGRSFQIKLKAHKDFYICPFFEPETNKCSVYIDRPLDCQLYPFVLMFNENSSSVVLGVDMLCPFGEAHSETEPFQQHLQQVIAYVESKTVREQLAANWSLIGEYQDTVKIFHTFNQNLIHAIATLNS